jgi:hypothetical protein
VQQPSGTGALPVGVRVRRLGRTDGPLLAQRARDEVAFDLAGRSSASEPLRPEAAEAYLSDPRVLHWVAEADGLIVGELACHALPLHRSTTEQLRIRTVVAPDAPP